MADKGIPTEYGGVRFRSRLEARWAAFFDLCRWPWDYEPLDLEGYLPDFALKFQAGPILVEVKPELTEEALVRHAAKMARAANHLPYEGLMLGAGFLVHDGYSPTIGLLAERDLPKREWAWAGAKLFTCGKCSGLSLHHETYSYRCRVHGCYDGDHYLGSVNGGGRLLWGKATTLSQWRG